MKSGCFAVFNGQEYSADYIKGKGIVLRSHDYKDLYSGFEKYNGYNKDIVCIKFVARSDVSEFYKVSYKAVYKGFEFEVVEERENKISIITMKGDYKDWINLDMKCIDKSVYQKWIDKEEAEIKIVKEDL